MTSFGINNNGHLVFDYYHEDYGENGVSGQLDVYNGKDSVLWVNFSQAFADEIKTTYSAWRSGSNPLLSYDKIVENFITNHSDRWSISIYNEDAEYKYISMYRNGEDKGDQYLYQVRGTGEEHLKYFVKNRLMYCDSKWQAGDFVNKDSNTIILRINSPIVDAAYPHLQPRTKIKYTTFSNMYAGVGYGAKAGVTHSAYVKKGQPVKFARGASFPDWCVGQELQTDDVIEYESKLYKVLQSHIAHESRTPDVASSFFEFIEVVHEDGGQNDLDTYIFGANEVSSLDDLSLLYCGDINISAASKLTTLIIGNSAEGYTNSNLKSLSLSNNRLLRILDVSNCTELKTTLDFTLCPDIQEIYAKGSGITGIILPSSGFLKKIHLPKIGSLIITNQHRIEEFECEGYEKLTTLNIDNATMVHRIDENTTESTDRFPLQEILLGCDISKIIDIKIKNIKWNVSSEENLRTIIDKLSSKQGVIIEGSVYLPSGTIVSDQLKRDTHAAFPNLNIIDADPIFYVDYYTYTNQFWDTEIVHEGEDAKGPQKGIPEHEIDEAKGFKHLFVGWDNLPTKVKQNCRVSAKWQTQYAVSFYNDDGSVRYDVLYYNVDEIPDDPVEYGVFEGELPEGKIYEPTKTSGTPDTLRYKFNGWALTANSNESLGTLPVVTGVTNFYATFAEQYPVKFYETSEGDSKQIQYGDTQWIIKGQDATKPATNPEKAPTDKDSYNFAGWNGNYTDVQAATNVYATYTPVERKYTVYFYNDNELLLTRENVSYTSSLTPENILSSEKLKKKIKDETTGEYVETDDYICQGWFTQLNSADSQIKYYAIFRYQAYISDSWQTIINNVKSKSVDELRTIYPIGARKKLTFSLEDGSVVDAVTCSGYGISVNNMSVDAEVIAYEHDDKADKTGKATMTFFCKDLPNISAGMLDGNGEYVGWYNSQIYNFLNTTLFNCLSNELKSNDGIKSVIKKSDDGNCRQSKLVETEDKFWLASVSEIGCDKAAAVSGQGELYSETFSLDSVNESEAKAKRQKILPNGVNFGTWLTRTTYLTDTEMFYMITTAGTTYQGGTWNKAYAPFGFCI